MLLLHIVLSLLVTYQTTIAQVLIRGCGKKGECITLPKCPPMLIKAQSQITSVKREVRDAFCGFQSGTMMVCCPKEATPAVTKSRLIVGDGSNRNGESLIPRNCGNPSVEDKIHGGTKAPLGAFPWVVAMGYDVNGRVDYSCGGSLINSRYVLTASHCINPDDLNGNKIVAINIGDWDLDNNGVDCEETNVGPNCAFGPRIIAGYEELILHPDYNKRFPLSDDIALIRLDRDIDLEATGIEPICLPPSGLDLTDKIINRLPIVAGWGFTERRVKSSILLSVGVPFANKTRCEDLFPESFQTKQICAGGVKGQDSCGGDSGGPLVMPGPRGPPYLQIGIVSFGPSPCGIQNRPGVYTSVAHYRKWIANNLRP